jgi:hypothetical protein
MVKGLGQICPQGQHKVNKAPEITVGEGGRLSCGSVEDEYCKHTGIQASTERALLPPMCPVLPRYCRTLHQVEVLEAQQMQARTRATEAFTSVSDAATDLAIFAASKAAISSEVTALAAATSKAIAAAKAGAAARAQAAAAARAAAKAKTS